MDNNFKYQGERFADIQMLRYRLPGFEALSLNQKLYIYYLSEATLWGRDITFDQFGKYNLLIRSTLEKIYVESIKRNCEADELANNCKLRRSPRFSAAPRQSQNVFCFALSLHGNCQL